MLSLNGGHISVMQRTSYNWADLVSPTTSNTSGSSNSSSSTKPVDANSCSESGSTIGDGKMVADGSIIVSPVETRPATPIMPDRPVYFTSQAGGGAQGGEADDFKGPAKCQQLPSQQEQEHEHTHIEAHDITFTTQQPVWTPTISKICNTLGSLSILTGTTVLTSQGLLKLLNLVVGQNIHNGHHQYRKGSRMTKKTRILSGSTLVNRRYTELNNTFGVSEFQLFLTKLNSNKTSSFSSGSSVLSSASSASLSSLSPPSSSMSAPLQTRIIKWLTSLIPALRGWKWVFKCLLWLFLSGGMVMVYPKLKQLIAKQDLLLTPDSSSDSSSSGSTPDQPLVSDE